MRLYSKTNDEKYSDLVYDHEKQLNNGDILIIDTGSTVNGYFCDFDRNFGFGKISQ
ncbi:M24 family metallopeptidase, partial [uncultured Microbacterium sp.]|uniref:M24 family metallopeptidase n=1 Tax=uncultured Microbacterium sp. TaxID=191216 RepID=UPI00338E6F9D